MEEAVKVYEKWKKTKKHEDEVLIESLKCVFETSFKEALLNKKVYVVFYLAGVPYYSWNYYEEMNLDNEYLIALKKVRLKDVTVVIYSILDENKSLVKRFLFVKKEKNLIKKIQTKVSNFLLKYVL